MFQLKCTPTLLATPGPVQINNSSTRWNSNEDKQLWVLSAPPGHWHTKLPFITCCKIFYSHLPHANEDAHVYSWWELQTTFHSIGWLSEPRVSWAGPGGGLLNIQLSSAKHTLKVSKPKAMEKVSLPLWAQAFAGFYILNSIPFYATPKIHYFLCLLFRGFLRMFPSGPFSNSS